MPIRAGSLLIPDSDLSVAFIKSGGPGGQNVNKVSSAVQLRFDLAGCALLDERVKTRLRRLAGRRLTDEGAVLLIARGERSQEQNRRDAEARLAALIEAALVEPKLRRPTRPTRASKQRRLEHKTRRGSIKRARGRPAGED
ncbi:MAG: alternative ribosome rescue aminoacyl-tRNA hydrolase ArfB [Steroidobacteraceae bacterium]|jgi:ribosome-associated protein